MGQPMQHVDIIIVGAGAAGLSLAYRLNQEEAGIKNVLLLDPNIKQSNDRTWCYWGKEALDIYKDSYHQWENIRMGLNGERYSRRLNKLSYHCLRSGDFYQKIQNEIDQNPGINFVQETVARISSDAQGASVWTAGGKEYTADWVFDSRPHSVSVSSFPENSTWQHFGGIEVRTEKDVFNPGEVTLMDFAFAETDGIKFAYILPFSSNSALVEITVFSKNPVDRQAFLTQAHQYIQDHFDTKVSEVLYSEIGSIPMTPHHFDRRPSPRVMRIGTVGGATRASTGYTFSNIQKDSIAIVASLQKNGHPFYGDVQTKRARFYDRLLLDLIEHEPHRVPKLFYNMFKSNKPDRVLRFLDGDTALYEEILLIFTLPWPPFLKALYRQIRPSKVYKQSPLIQSA